MDLVQRRGMWRLKFTLVILSYPMQCIYIYMIYVYNIIYNIYNVYNMYNIYIYT